jgi:methionyl-tRNA formyltransferase
LPLRILYAGTPEFALPALDALVAAGHAPVGVLTQPDRPAGRGLRAEPGPVKRRALTLGLPVLQPLTLRDEAAQAAVAAHAPDLLVVVAYGLILPGAVLALPRLGCVNVHASLLPRWRGAAPIQRAILAGDGVTGVSIMRMEEGLDTGPVYATRTTEIGRDETAGELHDRLAALGAGALVDALPGIADGTLLAEPQDAARATYATRIEKAEARINWRQPAEAIARRVRAFNPWPVADAGYGEARLRIWRASARPAGADVRAEPGTVVAAGADGIDVATGDGLLRVLSLQLPGRRVVAAGDFANSHAIAGVRLQ